MTKIRRQLRAAWRRGLLKVKLSPSCITRDIHLHTGKVDRSWPTHSTPTPPPAPPRLPPRITILHLFDYEPIASTLCRYIHDTYAFSYRYQWRTIREDLAFAATCRVIHAHMARITFRQIEIYPNTKDATRWHPDSLSSIRYIGAHWIYVRTLISRAISFTSSAAHRFLHPIHRILQLTPSVEHIFNDELHSHMLSAYCGPLTERFESVTSMDITSHDDPRTIRYLRCFPSLCALAITISPRPHRKLGDVSSVPPFKRVEYLAIAETLKDVTIKDWHIHRLLPNLTDLCVYSDDYKSRVPVSRVFLANALTHDRDVRSKWQPDFHISSGSCSPGINITTESTSSAMTNDWPKSSLFKRPFETYGTLRSRRLSKDNLHLCVRWSR